MSTDDLNDPRLCSQPDQSLLPLQDGLVANAGPDRCGKAAGRCRKIGPTQTTLRITGQGVGAAAERGVRSPLAELGFAKAEIRALSRATRYTLLGESIVRHVCVQASVGLGRHHERLGQVDAPKAALRALGIGGDLRVRHHGDLARVELDPAELARWLEPASRRLLREALLASGFARVALDLRGFRSGSLNVLGGVAGT